MAEDSLERERVWAKREGRSTSLHRRGAIHSGWSQSIGWWMKTVGKTMLLGEGRLQCQEGSLDFIPQTTGAIGHYYFNQIPLSRVMSVSKSKVRTCIQANQQLFYKHTHTHKYLCNHYRGGLSSGLCILLRWFCGQWHSAPTYSELDLSLGRTIKTNHIKLPIFKWVWCLQREISQGPPE